MQAFKSKSLFLFWSTAIYTGACLSCFICCCIYHPPKYNKDFIQEFSEFLAEVVPKYEQLLICGDFNIHACRPSDPLATDFKRLLASFDLTQSVDGPTHNNGRTLDLIISHGLSISLVEICVTPISDHLPIIFEVLAPSPVRKPPAPASRRRIITSSTAVGFAAGFMNTQFFAQNDTDLPECLDSFMSSFHATCSGILDNIAPFKCRTTKQRADPWLSDSTRALRQRWKKTDESNKLPLGHCSHKVAERSVHHSQAFDPGFN